jgi:phenylacetate-CoA ligase
LKLARTWRRLKSFQHKNIDEIKAYQLIRFKQLIQEAYECVPMYRELYDSLGFDPRSIHTYADIANVPIINKDIVRSFPVSKRVNSRLSKATIHRETTSGSTGQPIEIWTEQTESLIQTLKAIRFLGEWGYSPFDMTIQLWRADTKPKKSIVQKLGCLDRKIVSILNDVDTVITELTQTRCDVLYATRSSLEIFGSELMKRERTLRPKILVCCCEPLTETHQHLFKEIFGCDTLEIYGAVEAGNIGWGCPAQPDHLHLDLETVLVDFVNIETRPDGSKVGSIVVTNLENQVMPFIKYELGDLVLLPEHNLCACGRTLPVLGRVLGRNDDILEVNGRKFNFHYFYNYFKNFLYINQYKIVQTAEGDIEFRIHLTHDSTENQQRCLADLSAVFGEYFSPVNIHFVDGFSVSSNGKFKVLEKLS